MPGDPIMRDKPFGAALLDVAHQALTQDIAPALKGQQRYVVLMVANAIGIVAREIEQEVAVAKAWDRALARVDQDGNLEASASRLVEAIRNGHHDADPALQEGSWRPLSSRQGSGSPRSQSRPTSLRALERRRLFETGVSAA